MAMMACEDESFSIFTPDDSDTDSNHNSVVGLLTEKTLSIFEGFNFQDDIVEDNDQDQDQESEAINMTYITILPDSSTQQEPKDAAAISESKISARSEPPTQITILCNYSPAPITLDLQCLVAHSHLFATLAESDDPSTITSSASSPFPLNIDHESFSVFARWLRGGEIHVPKGDEKGLATDIYLLMRAHAAGEALGAGMFADMVMDEIIGELTKVEEDDDVASIIRADSRFKAYDLEILLSAASAIWPAGSLGRDLLVDWYVYSSASQLQNLSVEAVIEIGDLNLAARCMVLGKERQMARELGDLLVFEEAPPYLVDPCRYHEHQRAKEPTPCYKRSRDSAFSQLEYMVRCNIGVCEEDDDGDSGFGGGETPLWEYEACVDESLRMLEGDETAGGL